MPHDSDHHHGHDHGSELSEMQRRVRALETVLTEKGYIETEALDRIVEAYESRVGPHIGAKVVAVCTGFHDREDLEAENPMSVHDDFSDVDSIFEHLIA